MIRLGLCCLFRRAPIRFRTLTAAALLRRPRQERRKIISERCLENARALVSAVQWCADHGIGAFRVLSQILPLKTHPELGYDVGDLPDASQIVSTFREAGALARRVGVRLTFHPDQFVLLNSPNPRVVVASLAELDYQAEVAEWIGATDINIHGGGLYGDRRSALERLRRQLDRLPPRVRDRLTLENDDRLFTPSDLLPLCRDAGIPFCYDVHHHRCLPDKLPVGEVTRAALATWNREPLFHLSSPRGGWTARDPRQHADHIRPEDFPQEWRGLTLTVEVEAKAKEPAVLRLRHALRSQGVPVWPGD